MSPLFPWYLIFQERAGERGEKIRQWQIKSNRPLGTRSYPVPLLLRHTGELKPKGKRSCQNTAVIDRRRITAQALAWALCPARATASPRPPSHLFLGLALLLEEPVKGYSRKPGSMGLWCQYCGQWAPGPCLTARPPPGPSSLLWAIYISYLGSACSWVACHCHGGILHYSWKELF